jgi:ferrous iron transport protein A
MPLELMNSGERGVVLEVCGRPDFVVRLEEMGLHAGAKICMVRQGSPCIVELNHHKISFRLDDSGSVLVDVDQ